MRNRTRSGTLTVPRILNFIVDENVFQKEVRAQKLKEARREIALQEEELFFFDNYEQMEREKVRK